MIEIAYKGANYIALQTKQTLLVVDPMVPGLKGAKLREKADAQLLTQPQFAQEATEGQRIFSLPGEYEIGDFSIIAVDAEAQLKPEEKSVIFKASNSDCSVAIVGHVNPDKLTEEIYEKIGTVDVLIVPVGGNGYTIDSHGAAKITQHMSPKIVIPVHYDDSSIPYEVPQQPIADFVKELGIVARQEQALKIKQAGQLPEVLTLIQLAKTVA